VNDNQFLVHIHLHGRYLPNKPILSCTDTHCSSLRLVPDDGADCSIAAGSIWVGSQDEGLSFGSIQVEEADLLFVPALRISSASFFLDGMG
jgi:hypothetical protein